MKIELDIDDDIYRRLVEAFPNLAPSEVLLRAAKRAIGEAELTKFSEAKKAEIEAEARRLNTTLGLVG